MDRYIKERLDHLKRLGVKRVKPLASGRPDECAHCTAMSGRIFLIDEFPEYPPPGCNCQPTCGCVVVRVT